MARELVGRNFLLAVESRYPDMAKTAAYRKIESATGISLSTCQRIEEAKVGATLDNLADLAHHLGTTPQALLSPQNEVPVSPIGDSFSQLPQRLQRRRAAL